MAKNTRRMADGQTSNGAILRAARLIAAHPSVDDLGKVEDGPQLGAVTFRLSLRLGLPNAWTAAGCSPNGVLAVETVQMTLPADFPLAAPTIRLRPDFDRSLAHVNPGPPDEPPVPCIYDGSLLELVQQQGLAAVLNQLVLWLENAALGRLIDPEQGWEPVRRDSLDDFVVLDPAHLRGLVERRAGHAAFTFEYLAYPLEDGLQTRHGEIARERVAFKQGELHHRFSERSWPPHPEFVVGRSVAIFVWPGRHPSGAEIISDRYRPETVTDLGTLRERAADYGCADALQTAFDQLERCLAGCKPAGPLPLAVVLCARRPLPLIHSGSPLELCAYLVDIRGPKLFPHGDRTRVSPAGLRHAAAPRLLRSMAGIPEEAEARTWTLLGAGSLGSKLAMHLGRSGNAPRAVVDRAYFSPHNNARHGLSPLQGVTMAFEPKALALADSLRGLGQETTGCLADVLSVLRDPERIRSVLPGKDGAVVNATASLAVREALAAVPDAARLPRVIEAALFADGLVGLLSLEGAARNPNTGDLISEAYALMLDRDALRERVLTATGLRRQVTGEGCGSTTMVMSDARLSLTAAAMAEIVSGWLYQGLPVDAGRLMLGMVGADGISLSWSSYAVTPWHPVAVDGQAGWQVRISPRAHQKIAEEVGRWPGVETGGILVGRYSDAAQTFYVVDVLSAPDDSRRSAAEFVLGTAGARDRLRRYSESSGSSLYCLGTWHSHLIPSGPSALDRATAIAIGLARLLPSALLIHTPTGYRAVLADPAGPSGDAVATATPAGDRHG